MDENKTLAEDMDKFLNEMPYRGKAYQQLITDKDGKAHWEDRLAYDDQIEISWDGDITGRVSFTSPQMHIYYKISDLTPGKEEIIGGTVKFSSNYNPVVITQDITHSFGEGVYATGGDGAIIVSFVDNLDMGGIIIPEKGTYVWYREADEVIVYAKSLTYGKIKQLDEKFLPNLNIIFTGERRVGERRVMNCNFTYDQIREWIENDLPIIAIYKQSKLNRFLITNYELDVGGAVSIIFRTAGDSPYVFEYNSDGTLENCTPE